MSFIKDIYQASTIKVDWIAYLSLIPRMMVLPPIISLTYSIYVFWCKGFASKMATVQVMMAFACYIAIINCTKEHGGDQAEYWGVYEGVPIYGLRWAIDHIYGYRDATNGKEFMNGIYNYVGYWLTLGNYHLYIWINSILMYLPFFWCMRSLFQSHKNGKLMFLAGMTFLSFFPFFFVLTFQLQRQFVAYAIIMFLFVLKAETGKTNIYIALAALFSHSTAIAFMPLLFLDIFYNRITPKRLFLIAALFVPSFYIVSHIAVALEDTGGAVGYLATRINNQGTDGLEFKALQFYIFNLPMLFVTLLNIFRKDMSRLEYIVYNSYIFLFLFVVSLSGNELAQYRYGFFTYGYIGFIFPYFLQSEINLQKYYLKLASIGIVLFFYAYFGHLAWHYASNISTLCFPQFWHLFVDTVIAPMS